MRNVCEVLRNRSVDELTEACQSCLQVPGRILPNRHSPANDLNGFVDWGRFAKINTSDNQVGRIIRQGKGQVNGVALLLPFIRLRVELVAAILHEVQQRGPKLKTARDVGQS